MSSNSSLTQKINKQINKYHGQTFEHIPHQRKQMEATTDMKRTPVT
jgi:hypothetical protein